jgi:hypothetical protein
VDDSTVHDFGLGDFGRGFAKGVDGELPPGGRQTKLGGPTVIH